LPGLENPVFLGMNGVRLELDDVLARQIEDPIETSGRFDGR